MYDLIIIGAGPAGIFTALELLRTRQHGQKILLRGKGPVLWKRATVPRPRPAVCVNCKPYCHITTGFSGAGAFSDGKLSLCPARSAAICPTLIGAQNAQDADRLHRRHLSRVRRGQPRRGHRRTPRRCKRDSHAARFRPGCKLVDCPIRHLGTEKAQTLYLAHGELSARQRRGDDLRLGM